MGKHGKKKKQQKPKVLSASPKRLFDLTQLDTNKDLGIGIIPVMSSTVSGISVANHVYEILQPDGLVIPITVTFETHTRISKMLTLLRTTTGNDKLFSEIKSTWPHKWHYLSDSQLQYIETLGIPVISKSQRLMDIFEIASFPKWLIYGKNSDVFFDSWLEVVWQEYIVEYELLRYNKLPKHSKSANLPVHQNILNVRQAEAWVTLENCAVRIRSMWDRIHKYLIPLYFSGGLPNTSKTYWQDLDKEIRNWLSSKPELHLYEYIFDFIRNDIRGSNDGPKSQLKEIRDNIIHNLSHRPGEIISPRSSTNFNMPQNSEQFYEIVRDEHSRTRELLILIVAIMRSKTPENPLISKAMQ